MAMDVEEMIRCSPIDGVALLAGCDKTVPAPLMGAASAGKPAIMLTAGRGCGQFQERSIVTSDVWTLVPDRLEGRINDAEWDELKGAAEVLGMALPGSAAVPAVESRRRDLAERTGVRAVELARAGTRPEDVMTRPAFDNAIRVLSATGGSTDEFIHLVAIAGRLGISLEQCGTSGLARTGEGMARLRATSSGNTNPACQASRGSRGCEQRPTAAPGPAPATESILPFSKD